jgi:hypothetical protein
MIGDDDDDDDDDDDVANHISSSIVKYDNCMSVNRVRLVECL